MAQSVKLADLLVASARKESTLQSRSLAGQITHWVNIGRAIEQSSNFDYQRISGVLEAEASPDELTPEEQDVWFVQFSEQIVEASAEEVELFTSRRRLGQGVGLSDAGELVFEHLPEN